MTQLLASVTWYNAVVYHSWHLYTGASFPITTTHLDNPHTFGKMTTGPNYCNLAYTERNNNNRSA